MASLETSGKTGNRAISVNCPDGKRRRVRLGKVTLAVAREIKRNVEHLAAQKLSGAALPASTAEWVRGLPDKFRARLAVCGLVDDSGPGGCGAITLGAWLKEYVDGRGDVKPATALVYGHTRRNLLAFFGKGKALSSFTPGDADAFAVFLRTKANAEVGEDEEPAGLSDNTVRRRLGIAKQFFKGAMRRKLIDGNPFDGQTTAVRDNPRRRYFVSRPETEAILNALPDAKWRLAFALARYGGLRCPSEIVRLAWADVAWDRMRFTVHSPKTEHHSDAGIRVVPIFPELLPYFERAFDQAEPGELFCCPQYNPGSAGMMYRKIVLAAITRAGVKPWPKLFQNCRASRETELAENYPVQVVCSWIGNSPMVAAKHYLQVTDEHFERATGEPQKAAQKAAQQKLEMAEMQSSGRVALSGNPLFQGISEPCRPLHINMVGPLGLEPDDVSACNDKHLGRAAEIGGAKCGAFVSDLTEKGGAWQCLGCGRRHAEPQDAARCCGAGCRPVE